MSAIAEVTSKLIELVCRSGMKHLCRHGIGQQSSRDDRDELSLLMKVVVNAFFLPLAVHNT